MKFNDLRFNDFFDYLTQTSQIFADFFLCFLCFLREVYFSMTSLLCLGP